VTFLTTSPPLARALTERNFDSPTPVQTAVLAEAAAGRDLLVSAQTGSGKTVAYGLAIAKNLLDGAERFGRAAAPLALIVAPTRELALQVHRELAWLYQYADARVVSCVGGMDPRREQRELADGAHIVVGTPGRLCDHLRRGRLDVSQLKAVVLDEADEMLDLGFREDLEFILDAAPDDKRSLLFSATMPKAIAALAKRYQRDAWRIEVAGGKRGHVDIEYRAIRIAYKETEHAVVNLLRLIEAPTAIVFCNTREAVRHLHATLSERGFSVVALSGELTQNERTQALQALSDGRARVCVATDVAARGIDLPNLDLVIHSDLPNDAEVMQHRSGRTGRAGRKGVSVLLVPTARKRRAELLLNLASIDAVWATAPTADEIRKLDQERMLHDDLFAQETTAQDLEIARALLAERSPEEIAAALARLYRARLPSPEDMLDAGQGAGRSRDDRSRDKDRTSRGEKTSHGETASRGVDRAAGPRAKPGKSSPRHAMEGGVWFRAAIGRRKNAEARWLLPMICRRGGIDKNDIGAIRILDTTTEFEISAAAAESFAVKIRRPDKEDNIRLEPLTGAPQGHATAENRPQPPRREGKEMGGNVRHNEESRDQRGVRQHGKPHNGSGPEFGKPPPAYDKKKRFRDKPAHVHQSQPAAAAHAKPAFGKKSMKNRPGRR
jgi:ATP-dependent RNA helicase DeaD